MANDTRTQESPGGVTIISRRRFLKQTALATAVVSVPYLAGKKTVAFGKENAEDADAALDSALKELVAMDGGPPGVIAVVQRGQSREVHSFGVRNIKGDLPLRANDHMRIASAAKAFSGAVALSLVSKGVLSLNDTIGELLPDLPEDWHAVRLRQLLNHTSGILDFSLDEGFTDALIASPKNPPPPEELLSFVEDEPLKFDSGSRYEYSNSDNIVVGLMVEAATNRSYESQLQKYVFGPLGLTETSLPVGANLLKPFIHGYDPSQTPPEDVSEIIAARLGLRRHSVDPKGSQPLYTRLRWRTALRLQGALQATPGHRGRRLRAAGSGEERGRARTLPLRDQVRDGVGAYWKHPRLHPVCGGESRWGALSDGLRQRAAHPNDGHPSRLQGA